VDFRCPRRQCLECVSALLAPGLYLLVWLSESNSREGVMDRNITNHSKHPRVKTNTNLFGFFLGLRYLQQLRCGMGFYQGLFLGFV